MAEHLYIVVPHRSSEVQPFKNEWAGQGRLSSITTTPAVLAEAEKAIAAKSRIFIYETKCPKSLGTHISQEVQIAEINTPDHVITFSDHKLLYRKPPFRANQGLHFKWSAEEPNKAIL